MPAAPVVEALEPFQTAEERVRLANLPQGAYVRGDGVIMRPGPLLPSGKRRGALRVGGPGRPPRAIRAAYAAAFDDRLEIAAAIADDPTAKPADRLAALDLLGVYGVGRASAQLDDKGRAGRPRQVVVRFDQGRGSTSERPDFTEDQKLLAAPDGDE